MELNGAAIRAASTGFRAIFLEGFESVEAAHQGWMDEVTSTGSQETYHFPELLGDMREWLGDRQIEALERQDYTLKNKEWEKTIGIRRSSFEDDQLGGYRSQIRALGASAAAHPSALWVDLLTDGFTQQGYDGVAFFAATHPMADGSTQSNLQAGALSVTTFESAFAKLLGMKNWGGKPIDVLGFGGKLTLVVGPSLRVTARDIVAKEYVDGGDSNINFKAADLQVFPRLTGSHWFLGIRGGPLLPFLLQTRRKAQLVAQDQPRDDEVFHKNRVLYGTDGRWNAGYALWQLMVGSDGT